jgi:hypothetical protein
MKKRARLPQKIIDEYKRIAKNLLRKHADWDERIHRIHAAKIIRTQSLYTRALLLMASTELSTRFLTEKN